MRKATRKLVFLCMLPALWLLAAFLIGAIAFLLGKGSVAFAADDRVSNNQSYQNYQRGQYTQNNQIPQGQTCTSSHPKPFFNTNVVIDGNEVVCGDVTSFGGTVIVRGRIMGDVVAFSSKVLIDGVVNGDITLYGGSIALQNSANVYGDIHQCGSQPTLDTDAQLHGYVGDCSESVNQLLINGESPGFRFWSILTWIALGVFLISLLPEHVMLVRTTVTNKARRSVLLGLLSILLALPVLAILVALIISIPLAIIVAIGLVAAWALGTVAVGSLIGEHIMRAVAPRQNTRQMQVVVGLAILILVESLPYIGLLISIGAGLLGLGAVFLSRFGTRLYSQPKQPIML